jgi:hypothetical protein
LKSLTAILAPPLLCAGILGAIAVEKSTHVKPRDAAAYHARAKASIEQMDYTIGDVENGVWVGQDIEPTTAAVQLLRPNKIFSRRYTDTSSRTSRYSNTVCDVLIVQCRDSRDMVGHYPENCYRNGGEELIDKRNRDWVVGGVPITGTEYTFERYRRGHPVRRCVYNFIVVPGAGIMRDIKAVNRAAEDYQWRHFGAAQFQFVFQADEADLPRDKRDQIFSTLMGSNIGVLAVLNDVNAK